MIKTDILIIGAGVPGLTLAALLASSGLKMTVIDKQPCTVQPLASLPQSGRTSALLKDSLALLDDVGVLDAVRPYSAPLEVMRIHNKKVRTDFSAKEIGGDFFSLNIPNNILRQALINKVRELPAVTLMDGTGIWDFEARDNDIVVRLDDERDIAAKLVIGADGRESVTRTIAGLPVLKINYRQTAITCLINHSQAHQNTSTEFHRSGGPFTLVPMPGNMSSVVWCERDEDADAFMAMKKQDFEQALQDRTEGVLGGITLASAPESFKLRGLVARQLTAPRLALMAEAAHALHPIGAQGMNLSMRDVGALNILITRHHKLGLDIGAQALLDNYVRKRKRDIWTSFGMVSGLKSLTSHHSSLLQSIQRRGLKILGSQPFLKKQLMKIGMNH